MKLQTKATRVSSSSTDRLARCRKSDSRMGLAVRARRLLTTEIGFIPNPEFRVAGDESLDANALAETGDSRGSQPPGDLPGHLARMCEADLLSAEQERHLFRRMNYLKFRANALRSAIDPQHAVPDLLDEIEQLLAEAEQAREQIIQANTRLVISVVKQFVTPQHSFDELLSDGLLSLMQAVDKYDFARGFRFSTYAYRAISRNVFRRITDQKRNAKRLALATEEVMAQVPDRDAASASDDVAWDQLYDQINEGLSCLDARERFIVEGRFQLSGQRKGRTFQSLADELGISKERVRQLMQRAMGKLRRAAGDLRLEELAEPLLRWT